MRRYVFILKLLFVSFFLGFFICHYHEDNISLIISSYFDASGIFLSKYFNKKLILNDYILKLLDPYYGFVFICLVIFFKYLVKLVFYFLRKKNINDNFDKMSAKSFVFMFINLLLKPFLNFKRFNMPYFSVYLVLCFFFIFMLCLSLVPFITFFGVTNG